MSSNSFLADEKLIGDSGNINAGEVGGSGDAAAAVAAAAATAAAAAAVAAAAGVEGVVNAKGAVETIADVDAGVNANIDGNCATESPACAPAMLLVM